jgi:hypothetical protein
MATKKITELTNVTSVNDNDLLIVETSDGTRSVSKSDLIKIKSATISLLANAWNENGTFIQSIIINGATTNSKIDLQPDSVVLNQLINDRVSALYIENNGGTFTACAIGAAPTVDLTIQATITEVE